MGNTRNNNNIFWWGSNFTDWMPDNMLSRLLYDPTRFFDRRFLQKRWWQRNTNAVLNRGEMLAGLQPEVTISRLSLAVTDPRYVMNEATHEELMGMLDGYDIVAPLSHFDHVVALLSLVFGWDEVPYYVPDKPTRPTECWTCMGVETDEEICPDMEDCRAHVERKAPYDHLIFNKYKAKFLKQLEHLGPEFEAYVQTYKTELNRRRKMNDRTLRSKCVILTLVHIEDTRTINTGKQHPTHFFTMNMQPASVLPWCLMESIACGSLRHR